MYIKKLKLFNFRNLENQSVEFSPGINFIAGRNGQGKTNLIESIALLALARSFRTASSGELVRWGERSASVFAELALRYDDVEQGIAIDDGQKVAYINGNKISSITEYVGRFLCVSFSPDDLEIVKGAPQIRRRFIDKHTVDLNPALFRDILNYQRALKNKNALLRGGRSAPAALEPWNRLMAQHAARIIAARQSFVAALAQRASEYHAGIAGVNTALSLRLKSALTRRGDQPDVETIFELFMEKAATEIEHGSSRIGPHRDDLEILLDDRPAQAYASQGQARTIVLALKLAVIRLLEEVREELPVLLLDDVDSELDGARREALFHLLQAFSGQVLVTGTAVSNLIPDNQKSVNLLELSGGGIAVSG